MRLSRRHRVDVGSWRAALARAGSSALRRAGLNAWPILQQTAAATAAWVVAKHLVDHDEPFFAPIAAVVALNASRGDRGSNAARLLLGVVVGIVVAEVGLTVLGPGYGTLAASTFAAMLIAVLLGGDRLVIAQAAAGSILTIAAGSAEVGGERLIDALIGAGAALIFSQLLFPTEPIALLRRAEREALEEMAGGLRASARALQGDDESADAALDRLRRVRDQLTELARTRASSRSVVRRSALRLRGSGPVVRESENAGQLDILGGSCLMLARTAMATDAEEHGHAARAVGGLADAIALVAGDLGDHATRQLAADRALEIARDLTGPVPSDDPISTTARVMARVVATDLMVFAGVEAAEAAEAVRASSGDPKVAVPPKPAALPIPPLPRRRGGS